MNAPTVTPELRALLRRVQLGRCLDTLPERLALARTGEMGHAEFLELVLADEMPPAARPPPPTGDQKQPGSTRQSTLDRWDDSAKITYDHHVWNELWSLRFVESGHNAVDHGPRRCRQNLRRHRARSRRRSAAASPSTSNAATDSSNGYAPRRLDNSHDTEMRKLLRVDLLIVDDFALQALDAARHRRRLRAHRRTAPRRGDRRRPRTVNRSSGSA